MLRIATINIASASVERSERLAAWLPTLEADVIVLSETSDGRGTHMLNNWFRRQGWKGVVGVSAGKERGAGVFSRVEFAELSKRPVDDELPARSVLVELATQPTPLTIIGMYLPNRGNDPLKMDRKSKYMRAWEAFFPQLTSVGPTLLIGDLNIVPRGQTPRFLPQLSFEYEWLDGLLAAGFVDLATRLGRSHEPTWVAHTGEGYTYDHAYLTSDLAATHRATGYAHETRVEKVSDHSGLWLDLDVEAKVIADRLSVAPLIPDQPSLFD